MISILALLSIVPSPPLQPQELNPQAGRWTRVDQPLVDHNAGLGIGLAFDATTMIAGAPHAVAGVEEDLFFQTPTGPPGSVTFYERAHSQADWVETQWLRPSLASPRDRFGVSIVLDGDTAFIGAPTTEVGGLRTGVVYRFERVGSQWIERQVIHSPVAHDFAGFGNHLAFDGHQLAVGAPFQDGATINEWGRGFVFEESTASADWVVTGSLEPPVMPDKSWAGYRVAIDGDVAALGLFGSEVGGEGAGAICVFQRVGQNWVPVQQVLPSVQVPFSHFSYDIILKGDLMISGAYRSGPPGHHHGSVNVFRRLSPGAGFVEVQRIVPPGLEFGAVMGVACALLDDGRLAAGIAGAHGIAGRVGLFSPRPNGTYRLDGISYPAGLLPGGAFGWKMATDGQQLAAGAPREQVAGAARGAVYTWDPDRVSYERPHCGSANLTANPSPILLRSHGSLDAGGIGVRLSVSELPPQTRIILIGAPATAGGPSLGCLRGPATRVSGGPVNSDPNGGCTWWLGGTNAASACVAGTTWGFQVWAMHGGALVTSNALELVFK